MATSPDFECQDFGDEAAITDVADLLGYVGFEPGVEARLPEHVTCESAASRDQVDGHPFKRDSNGEQLPRLDPYGIKCSASDRWISLSDAGVSGASPINMSTSLSRRSVPLAWEPARLTDFTYLWNFQPRSVICHRGRVENGDSQPISASFSKTVDDPFFEIGRQSPFSLEASVLGPVDGGGGAHGAEAIEKANDEEDQTVVGGTDVIVFESSMFQAATNIQIVTRAAEVGGEGADGPDGGCREQTGEDWWRTGGLAADY